MGNSLLPHVKVVWNTEAMAVSGKVVPLVHINAITLVGHYLVQKSHQQQTKIREHLCSIHMQIQLFLSVYFTNIHTNMFTS